MEVLGTVDRLVFELLETLFGVGGQHVHPIDSRAAQDADLTTVNVAKFNYVDFRCSVIEPAPAIIGLSGVADSQV